MKQYWFLFTFLLLLHETTFAQSQLDNAITDISGDLSVKINRLGKKKVAVLYITDINKAPSVAGKYLADAVSFNIVNAGNGFQVFDRDNLEGIVDAKKLIADGYINASKAKELGQLLSVEVIVVGNYTVLSNTIKLSLKAISVENGLVLASSMKDLPLDDDASALLGVNAVGNANRGFNSPMNSSESYNNPETVDKDCEKKKTGDYCFTNTRKVAISVAIEPENAYKNGKGEFRAEMTLDPGQTQCVYGRYAQPYEYFIWVGKYENIKKGQIVFEQCKSKTFIIK